MATRQLEKYKWTKDGRKWVFYTYLPTLNGKRKKYTSSAFKTKKEALEAEAEFALKYSGKPLDDNITFKQLYTLYYEYQLDKVKQTTIKTYKDRIPYMSLLDNIKLKDLNSTHYELWRKEINKLKIATSYKNDIQKFIKIVLNWGSRMYGYEFSKFYMRITKFTDPYEIKKEMDFYTLYEFKQFISYAPDLTWKCLFETLYYCGLRRGEARALNWGDINFENKTIRVNKNCITIGSESSSNYEITTPKTNSSVRTIPIPDILLVDLQELFAKQQMIKGFKRNWFVFGSNIPIKNSIMRMRKNKLCDNAGLRHIRLHDFRHSCASLLINNGANITIVAKYLGHTKVDETLNTYSHMYESKLNDIVSTINNLA